MLNITQASVSRYIRAARQQISEYVAPPDEQAFTAPKPDSNIYNRKTAAEIAQTESIARAKRQIAQAESDDSAKKHNARYKHGQSRKHSRQKDEPQKPD